MPKIVFCIALVIGCLPSAAAASSDTFRDSGSASGETLVLDTYQSPNTGVAGPIVSMKALNKDTLYVVRVQGTFSAFQPYLWTDPPHPYLFACGNPEAAPLFPSPVGNQTGQVGADPQFIFATIARDGCPSPGFFPRTYTNFQMNLGGGFRHYDPSVGSASSPAQDHSYVYIVRGEGSRLSLEELDANTLDNYGQYHITISRGADTCKKSGWQSFGYFKNQGDCVSYFATDGRNPPARVAQSNAYAPTDMNPEDHPTS